MRAAHFSGEPKGVWLAMGIDHLASPGPTWRSWSITGLLTICFTLSYLDRQVMSILVGPIKYSLRLSDTQIGLLQGLSFSLFYVAASLPLARLADQTHRGRLMGACLAAWSTMTMLCGLAGNFAQLLLARIGVASGEAGLPPAALTMMADMFDSRRLARATSIFMLAPSLGGGIALLGGGTLYAATANWTLPSIPGFGQLERWQLIFIMVGAPGALIAALVWSIPEPRRDAVAKREFVSRAALFRFIRRDRRFTGTYMLSMALMVMLLMSYAAWLPAAIIRSQSVDERIVGLLWGPIFLGAGAAGTLLGGFWIGREAADVPGRTMRLMRACAYALLPLALIGPLAPSILLELIAMGGAVFLISLINGLSSLPLQYIAPVPLRAQAIALQGLMAALLGTGMGPLITGALSDTVNRGKHSLAIALVIVGGCVVPTLILLLNLVCTQARERETKGAPLRRPPPPCE
jgi:MFS family permease